MERGLVVQDVEQVSILDENERYSSQTNVKHTKDMPVLGFVTPWNHRSHCTCLNHLQMAMMSLRSLEASSLTLVPVGSKFAGMSPCCSLDLEMKPKR